MCTQKKARMRFPYCPILLPPPLCEFAAVEFEMRRLVRPALKRPACGLFDNQIEYLAKCIGWVQHVAGGGHVECETPPG